MTLVRELSSAAVLKPVHTFPARMAASVALKQLGHTTDGFELRVLDPMAGSGTAIVAGRMYGHHAMGFDTDPLAVLISNAWNLSVDSQAVRERAVAALLEARRQAREISAGDAYPCSISDRETRSFVRYWFDLTNRRHLTALSMAIEMERDESIRTLLWCAFSRLIIAKKAGVSLAMDLAHSRPHRVRDRAPMKAFNAFPSSVNRCLAALESRGPVSGQGSVALGDARDLPIDSDSMDLVITSPPYLNAIDYMRCHKFSLVWMGYSIAALRAIRSGNIGTEAGGHREDFSGDEDRVLSRMVTGIRKLQARQRNMLRRYVRDTNLMLREVSRVLKPGGLATFVIGNSNLRGASVRNSKGICLLAETHDLNLLRSQSRRIPDAHRYLPPPSRTDKPIGNRMRTEVVLTFRKH